MANDDLRLLAKNIKRKKTQAIADLLRKLERSSNFCIWNSLYKVHGIESFDATILLQNPQCAKRLLAVLRDPQFNVFSNAIFWNHLEFAESLLKIVPECAITGEVDHLRPFERARTREALQLFFDYKVPLEVERQRGLVLSLRGCAGDFRSVQLLLEKGFLVTTTLYVKVLQAWVSSTFDMRAFDFDNIPPKVLDLLKTRLSSFQMRQASLMFWRTYLYRAHLHPDIEQIIAKIAKGYLMSCNATSWTRSLDLADSKTNLVRYLRQLERHLLSTAALRKIPTEILLIVRDYCTPPYVVQHVKGFPSPFSSMQILLPAELIHAILMLCANIDKLAKHADIAATCGEDIFGCQETDCHKCAYEKYGIDYRNLCSVWKQSSSVGYCSHNTFDKIVMQARNEIGASCQNTKESNPVLAFLDMCHKYFPQLDLTLPNQLSSHVSIISLESVFKMGKEMNFVQ